MPTYREDLHLGHKVPLVETDDLMDCAVTTCKLADGCVTTPKIRDGAVTMPKLGLDVLKRLDSIELTVKELQFIVEQLIGGNVINMSVEPSSVTYGAACNVDVTVTSAMSADEIRIYRNDLAHEVFVGDGKTVTVRDTFTPDSMEAVRYIAHVTANGMTKTAEKEVTVNKGDCGIKWKKNGVEVDRDTVNMEDASAHVYPTLSNPNTVAPIAYTSLDTSIAEINRDTGVITLVAAGNATIRAAFAGDERYEPARKDYTLSVQAAADYYVGWTTGTKADFASKTVEQLVASAYDKYINSTPVYNGSFGTNNIFFLMYQQSKAPKTVILHSGGQSMEQDIVDDNTCPHADVVIDDTTYKIFGIWTIPSLHDPNDTMTLNF